MSSASADGIVFTPSHNPPEDGGFKYTPSVANKFAGQWLDIDFTGMLPADDSADGFDNIIDVLTMSPLLMEKYLTAARKIGQRAVMTCPRRLPQLIQDTGVHRLNRTEYANTVRDLLTVGLELASGLSFFLWSSVPDEELLGAQAIASIATGGSI